MTFTSLDSMGKTNLMLDLISQRQRALGSNVANVDTPGYVRRDIDFSSYLGTMNSPLETKLSTELGPSGILEDRQKQEIDIAERIIFTIVTGSGSGKLCWHSRGTDNDQENAGYVRKSVGGSEQA